MPENSFRKCSTVAWYQSRGISNLKAKFLRNWGMSEIKKKVGIQPWLVCAAAGILWRHSFCHFDIRSLSGEKSLIFILQFCHEEEITAQMPFKQVNAKSKWFPVTMLISSYLSSLLHWCISLQTWSQPRSTPLFQTKGSKVSCLHVTCSYWGRPIKDEVTAGSHLPSSLLF